MATGQTEFVRNGRASGACVGSFRAYVLFRQLYPQYVKHSAEIGFRVRPRCPSISYPYEIDHYA
jgi:hypothetical protein